MSTKLGWFGVRDCSRTNLIEALQTIATASKKLELPSDGFLLTSARGHTSASLLGWEYAAVHDWARCVSKDLDTTAVSFFLLEGCWDYSVHRAGSTIAAMSWYPEERPRVTGNFAQAGAVLGVDESVFRRYHAAILEQLGRDEGDGDALRAYDDDKYEIWNDWVHCDLARRLGFVYPEPGSKPVVITR